MFNITAFAARTQDMFQSLENNLSGIIELQNERRRLDYETRQTRETRETRESSQNSNIRQPMSQSSNEPRTTTGPTTPITPPPITNRGLTDNINYLLGRRNIFDSSNNVLFSFLPRNVLLNPTTLSENIGGRTTRRNINGLTIQEIEDNTEIITYSSITTDQRLNTECPISRDPFNENSIVLRVKECRHCFVPFRMMTWLESHSTCPLCRENVVPSAPAPAPAPAAAPNAAPASTNTFSNIINNIRNSTNLNNLSIDNMNDDSIMFSFDLPRTQNDIYDREFTNTYLSSLSEIFSNLSRNTPAATAATAATLATTDASANPTQANSESNEYEEVD